MIMQAALHGQGVALAWDTMVGNELATGRLIKFFQGRFEVTNAFFAVSTPENAQKPRTQAFREWIITQAQTESEAKQSRLSLFGEQRYNASDFTGDGAGE